MYEEVKEAIKERVALGITKEAIGAELKSAGYQDDLIERLYQESVHPGAASEPVMTTIPGPVEPALKETKSVSEGYGSLSTEVPVVGKKSSLVIIALFIQVILIGVLIGIFSGGFAKMQGFSQSLFGGAPYTTESAMIIGVLESIEATNVFEMNIKAEVNLEPRASSTPELKDSGLESDLILLQEYGLNIPEEGHAKYYFSGLVDMSDEENIEFDLSAEFDVQLNEMIANAAGSLKLVDKTLYGRISKVSDLYEMYTFGMPVEQWFIITTDVDEFKDKFLGLETTTPANYLIENIKVALSYVESNNLNIKPLRSELMALSSINNLLDSSGSQMATGIQSLYSDTESLTEEEKEMRAITIELIDERPIFKFVGKPEKVSIDGEDLFQYGVDINHDSLSWYLLRVMEVSKKYYNSEDYNDPSVVTSTYEVDLTDIPTKETIDLFNRLSDWTYTFKADGTFAGVSLETLFALPGDSLAIQVRGLLEMTLRDVDKNVKVPLPENVFEQSFEEIMEDSFKAAYGAGTDAAIKQTLNNMRAQAEIIYDSEGLGYSSVCADSGSQLLFESMLDLYDYPVMIKNNTASKPGSIVCNDSVISYAVAAPLTTDDGVLWCVDSTGYVGFSPITTFSLSEDTFCEQLIESAPPVDNIALPYKELKFEDQFRKISIEAEALYLNDLNSPSYSAICRRAFEVMENVDSMICRANTADYVLYAPHPEKTGYFCVDSQGYFGIAETEINKGGLSCW